MRKLDDLRQSKFDIVVIGGGGFGAAAAWEAVQRGYSVALIDKHDFGSGVSANSYKMVHGGIRYLQHLDLPRLWSSCRERSAWLRIAPHLVKPLPIAMPTYGYGRSGKPFLGAGFLAYDVLTLNRNRGIGDRARHIPNMHLMSVSEVRRRFPGMPEQSLTGAAVFHDGQMTHPPRMVLAFVASAARKGAVVSNYVEALKVNVAGGRVAGVRARDALTGEEFDIAARFVLNGAGPWAEALAATTSDAPFQQRGVYSRDTAFVIDGIEEQEYALAIEGRSHDSDALLSRAARHLFIVPWRGKSLVGVWHIVFRQGADRVRIGEEEIERFLGEFNAAYPGLGIRREQIRLFNAGLVPFGDSDDVGSRLSFGKRSVFLDGVKDSGVDGLLSVIGVRHTMARYDAEAALDRIDKWFRRRGKAPDTREIPLDGGDIDNVARFARSVVPEGVSADTRSAIVDGVDLYGTRISDVLTRAQRLSGTDCDIDPSSWLRAQIEFAVDEEWAYSLADVVFRRTPLAAAGDPGADTLEQVANEMARKMGWDTGRRDEELAAVRARFPGPASAGLVSEAELNEPPPRLQRHVARESA